MQTIHRYKILEELSSKDGAVLYHASPSGSQSIWTLLKWTPSVEAASTANGDFLKATRGWSDQEFEPFIYRGQLCLASHHRSLLETRVGMLRRNGILGPETEDVLLSPLSPLAAVSAPGPLQEIRPNEAPPVMSPAQREITAEIPVVSTPVTPVHNIQQPVVQPTHPEVVASPPKRSRRLIWMLAAVGLCIAGVAILLIVQPTKVSLEPPQNAFPVPVGKEPARLVAGTPIADSSPRDLPHPGPAEREQPNPQLSETAGGIKISEGTDGLRFAAEPRAVALNSSFELAWNVAGAQEVQIRLDQRPRNSQFQFSHKSRESSGRLRIDTNPALFTTSGKYVFRLVATTADGTIKQSVTTLNLVKGKGF